MEIIKTIRSLYLPSEPRYIRKWSVISHWFLGALCAYLIAIGRQDIALTLMGMFGILEYWNDKEDKIRNPKYIPCGCTDWWDAFVVLIAGISLWVILTAVGLLPLH